MEQRLSRESGVFEISRSQLTGFVSDPLMVVWSVGRVELDCLALAADRPCWEGLSMGQTMWRAVGHAVGRVCLSVGSQAVIQARLWKAGHGLALLHSVP